MNLYKIVVGLLIVWFCYSCSGLINFNPEDPLKGFISRYSDTQKNYPGLLVKTDPSSSVCDLRYAEHSPVYLVNGLQIQQCLKNYDDAIVYIWDAHCTSKRCYSPGLLQRFCNTKNVELFVVAEYFDGEELTQFYEIEHPLYGIDTEYYKTNFIEKYVGKFEADLAVGEDRPGRMLYFKKGKYIGAAEIEFEK